MKIFNFVKLFIENLSNYKFENFTKKFYILFFSWFLFITIITGSLLSNKNILKIFVPFGLFSHEINQDLKNYLIFNYNEEEGIYSYKRQLDIDEDDIRNKIYTLFGEIGVYPYFSGDRLLTTRVKDSSLKISKLQESVNAIWIRGNVCLIDFDKEKFEKSFELNNSKKNYINLFTPENLEDEKKIVDKKREILFQLIQNTILNNNKNLQEVQFQFTTKFISSNE